MYNLSQEALRKLLEDAYRAGKRRQAYEHLPFAIAKRNFRPMPLDMLAYITSQLAALPDGEGEFHKTIKILHSETETFVKEVQLLSNSIESYKQTKPLPDTAVVNGGTVCVFCDMPCDDAPTERGWVRVSYGRGLHFDCAKKVVDTVDTINKIESVNGGMKWVKASERLPEVGEDEATEVIINSRVENEKEKDDVVLSGVFYNGKFYIGTEWNSEYPDEITPIKDGRISHWMPLPPSPTDEGQK